MRLNGHKSPYKDWIEVKSCVYSPLAASTTLPICSPSLVALAHLSHKWEFPLWILDSSELLNLRVMKFGFVSNHSRSTKKSWCGHSPNLRGNLSLLEYGSCQSVAIKQKTGASLKHKVHFHSTSAAETRISNTFGERVSKAFYPKAT